MKKEDISSLIKLIKDLEDSFSKFEKAYQEEDTPNFNKFKKNIIQIQKEMFEIVK